MNLKDKLDNIKTPHVQSLEHGSASNIAELWDNFIKPKLPKRETALIWHRVLMDYIIQPNAVFPVRGYNSEVDHTQYGKLRRGFLTLTDDKYSFFYTDNFHAAYYLKMAIDGYIPTVQELLNTYQQREFPSRFGRDTEEERELMAIQKGKDPGFQTSGYMIAHIFDAGKSFYENGRALSLKRHILDVYFPRGERSDWIQREDKAGKFYLRELHVAPEAKKYMVAAFLRFVHPFNYFVMPKRGCCSMDISGDMQLLNFVKYKFKEMYGSAYDEFLALTMSDGNFPHQAYNSILTDYKYGFSQAISANRCATRKARETNAQKEQSPNNCVQKRTGQIAQNELRSKLENISLEEAEKFTTIEYTQQFFNLSYPLLSKDRQPDHKGRHRYYADSIQVQGQIFYITSQWYERQRISVIDWISSH